MASHPSLLSWELPKLRQKVRLYRTGEVVEIFCHRDLRWHADGEVLEVVSESVEEQGISVVAGSMKIGYNHGHSTRWVAPQETSALLRPSPRPQPPPPLQGDFLQWQESPHAPGWIKASIQLQKGHLQWWASCHESASDTPVSGSLDLLNLAETSFDGTSLQISDGDVVYTFQTSWEEEALDLEEALWAHVEYREQVRDLEDVSSSCTNSPASGQHTPLSLPGVMRRSAKQMPLISQTSSEFVRCGGA